MTAPTTIAVASVCAAFALWLLLPRARSGSQRLGVVLGLMSVGLFGWLAASMATGSSYVFFTLAAVAIVAGAGTITMRNPVYSAIWFALCLLSIGALLLFTAAQFLAVATVAVYAGAILVTLLFVLMLAQPDGHAVYDRISWEPMISAFAGAALIGVLSSAVYQAMLPQAGTYARQGTPRDHAIREGYTQIATAVLEAQHSVSAGPAAILAMEITNHVAATSHHRSAQDQRQDVKAGQHMAHVGAQLFSKHLISVQLAAVLLLIALVGAVAIVIQGRQRQTLTEADNS